MPDTTAEMNIRIGGLRYGSFDEGPGSRTVVWFAGCSLRCAQCLNPRLFPVNSGELLTVEEAGRRLLAGRDRGDCGASFVGGEPFDQPEALAALCRRVREAWSPSPSAPLIIVYSGYTLEALRSRKHPAINAVLQTADVLVDGPYVASLADDNLGYRGSRNQRVIHLPATLGTRRIATLDWDSPRITISRGRAIMPPALARRLGLPDRAARHCGKSGGQ